MKHLVMVFALLVAAIVQAVTPAWTQLGMAKLPLILGVVLYYALTKSRNDMLWAAFIGGLLQDSLGMIPLGTSALCFCAVAAMINHFREQIFVRQVITHVLFGAAVNLLFTLGMFVLLRMDGSLVVMPRFFFKLAGALVLGAAVMPPVFYAIESLESRVGIAVQRGY